ncbi:MAG TPA: hypothetical protein VFS30_14740, partial [Dehalococcoidia bacterium]|nr:hypothetical protein [Dehalococcoidia bacterium]
GLCGPAAEVPSISQPEGCTHPRGSGEEGNGTQEGKSGSANRAFEFLHLVNHPSGSSHEFLSLQEFIATFVLPNQHAYLTRQLESVPPVMDFQ